MKIYFFLILIINAPFGVFYSQKNDSRIEEGVNLHNAGNYHQAIEKFEAVLEDNPTNLIAMGEQAYSLMMLNKYTDVASLCEKAIKIAPNSKELRTIYTTYANSYDMMGQPKQALKIYDEGLEKFPNYYHLYFNKGITYSQIDSVGLAIENFEKAIAIQPYHSGSHNALARMQYVKQQKIPSLMAFCRFMIIEPYGKRAKSNLPYIQDITQGNAKETGRNSVAINLDVTEHSKNSIKKENDFSATGLIMALNAGMNFTNKNKKKSEVELFQNNIEAMCLSLEELKKDNKGFYWEYYAPYYIEMKNQKMLETFSYIAFASSEERYIKKWLSKHKNKLDEFYNWSNNYKWN